MLFQTIVFYSFAVLLIFSALMVISNKHSVKAALFLVLAFVSASGIWMLLEAEFLAISLIVVYVGAVMVLFLFVVMMMDVDYAALRQGFVKRLPLALLISALFFALLYGLVTQGYFSDENYPLPVAKDANYSNIKALGRVLYTDYVIAFEIAAVILLLAIISAIALTFRGRRHAKSQNITKQLEANKDNRLKIIKMKPVVKQAEEKSSDESDSNVSPNKGDKKS